MIQSQFWILRLFSFCGFSLLFNSILFKLISMPYCVNLKWVLWLFCLHVQKSFFILSILKYQIKCMKNVLWFGSLKTEIKSTLKIKGEYIKSSHLKFLAWPGGYYYEYEKIEMNRDSRNYSWMNALIDCD